MTTYVMFRGTEYLVPAGFTAEQARAELRDRYPDVANADPVTRRERRAGEEVKIIEFVPRAGVKGAGPLDGGRRAGGRP
ncbi:MAG: hypothetical protein IT340_12515 [Chloroflexi bacterium]|nr:hypothetical protein [Chloroflexota bacterium]